MHVTCQRCLKTDADVCKCYWRIKIRFYPYFPWPYGDRIENNLCQIKSCFLVLCSLYHGTRICLKSAEEGSNGHRGLRTKSKAPSAGTVSQSGAPANSQNSAAAELQKAVWTFSVSATEKAISREKYSGHRHPKPEHKFFCIADPSQVINWQIHLKLTLGSPDPKAQRWA